MGQRTNAGSAASRGPVSHAYRRDSTVMTVGPIHNYLDDSWNFHEMLPGRRCGKICTDVGRRLESSGRWYPPLVST
jgi:hypothetical protein